MRIGLVNIKEASRLTGISVSRLYKLTMPKVAGVPCYKVGGSVRFSPEELEDWLAGQRRPTLEERRNAAISHLNAESEKTYGQGVNARQNERNTAKNVRYYTQPGAGCEGRSHENTI